MKFGEQKLNQYVAGAALLLALLVMRYVGYWAMKWLGLDWNAYIPLSDWHTLTKLATAIGLALLACCIAYFFALAIIVRMLKLLHINPYDRNRQ